MTRSRERSTPGWRGSLAVRSVSWPRASVDSGCWDRSYSSATVNRCRSRADVSVRCWRCFDGRRSAALARSLDRRAVGGASAGERGVGVARAPLEAAGSARRPRRARRRRVLAARRGRRARLLAVRRAGGSGQSGSGPARALLREALGLVARRAVVRRRLRGKRRAVAPGARGEAASGAVAASRSRPRGRRGRRARGRARVAGVGASVRGAVVGSADAGAVQVGAPGGRARRVRPRAARVRG